MAQSLPSIKNARRVSPAGIANLHSPGACLRRINFTPDRSHQPWRAVQANSIALVIYKEEYTVYVEPAQGSGWKDPVGT
jgi:hypothetical protein